MSNLRAGPARVREDPRREAQRRAIEARARAEASIREEIPRLEALEAEIAELEPRAGRGRRAAAALSGGRLWGLLAGDGGGIRRRGLEARRRAAKLRRRRFRLSRRKRALTAGPAEPLRAAAARLRQHRGETRGRASRRPPSSIRSLGDIVLIGAGAREAESERLTRLVEPLRADPGLGAAAEASMRFEWADAAPRPIVDSPRGVRDAGKKGACPAVALAGELMAVRRELLDEDQLCAGYRGSLWLTDLSLSVAARGYRLAAIPAGDGAPAGEAPSGGSPEDLALLRRRWGPALRRRILADLLAGGGEWCARAARVLVCPGCPPAVAEAVTELGLKRASDTVDADVTIGVDLEGGLTADWILEGQRSAAALSGLAGPGGTATTRARALGDALAASTRAPAYCVRIASRDWEAAGYGGDVALAHSLARALGERGHQALLQVDADANRPAGDCLDVLLALRGRRTGEPTPGRLNLIWLISHPEEVEAEELNRYDRVLVASRRYARDLATSVHPRVEPLLQFTDPKQFHPVAGATPKHDVAFAGNWRGEFRRIVWDALATDHPPALYGRGWDLLAPEHAVAEHVPHAELARLYSSCQILLCDHWDDMRRHGFISNRVFDALACETFAIADDNPALAEELPGAVETYSSPSELRDKLDRYLSHPEERKKIVRRGRAMVMAEHTVARRAEELLAIAAAAARECDRQTIRHLKEERGGRPPGAPAAGGASAAEAAWREAGAERA